MYREERNNIHTESLVFFYVLNHHGETKTIHRDLLRHPIGLEVMAAVVLFISGTKYARAARIAWLVGWASCPAAAMCILVPIIVDTTAALASRDLPQGARFASFLAPVLFAISTVVIHQILESCIMHGVIRERNS